MQQLIMDAFRLFSVFISVLFTFICYRIYILTKGGSKGWVYGAVALVFLGIWATLNVVFSRIIDIEWLRVWVTITCYVMISVFAPLSTINLAKDMGAKLPRIFMQKGFIIYISSVFLVITAWYFLTPITNYDNKLASLMHLVLAVSFLPAIYSSWKLSGAAKKIAWKLIFSFFVLLAAGFFMGVFAANCCGEGGDFADQPACASYSADFINIFHNPCAGFAGILMLYNLVELVGLVLGLVGFMLLWKPLEFH